MGIKKALFILTVPIIIFGSCVNTKKYTYFNDIKKASKLISEPNNVEQIRVQTGDILQIVISTLDRDISATLNPIATTAGSFGNGIAQGYLVDSAGFIEVPVAGKTFVSGHTTSEINENIKSLLSKTINNLFVSTRLLNFRISVIGDVARPGSYNIANEKVSILDALSMAGDLNITAVRDDIMLIRESAGKKSYVSIDLNDSKTLSSPYYYLANNDIIYVKPGANKIFSSSRGFQLLPYVFSTVSLIITVLIYVRR